jgi:hypothetical protein
MTFPAVTDRPCPLCGSHVARAHVSSRRRAELRPLAELEPYWFGIDKERRFFTYHRCADCGLLYNRSFFDDAQLADLYAAMPPNMDQVSDAAITATQHGYFAQTLRRIAPGGDYLEIGPDVGHIAAEAAAVGFERFWLFEPNRGVHPRLRAAVAGRPAEILTDMTDLSAVPPASVTLAVMVHVLDHLLDPLAMLADIRAKLRPGGMLMIVTHDEGSLLARALGPRWPAYCLQHPELYNPATITRLLGRAGFDGVEVTRSANHFPVDFLARQAAQAVGLRALGRVPLPKRAVRLRLGNMLTFAIAPAQAATGAGAAETRMRLESAA